MNTNQQSMQLIESRKKIKTNLEQQQGLLELGILTHRLQKNFVLCGDRHVLQNGQIVVRCGRKRTLCGKNKNRQENVSNNMYTP